MALSDLYKKTVLEHNRSPRNFRVMANANHQARGLNALCGDDLRVFLRIEDQIITDISFLGDACAISMASASMMTEHLKSKPVSHARAQFELFCGLMAGDITQTDALGQLNSMSGVRRFPSRIKSATLCWYAMRAALDGEDMVTTER